VKLSEIRSLLTQRDIRLTKSLGQNFLHDGNQLRRIVDAAELTPHDKVLEIGPGLGPLTELLAEKAGEVLAIEMDRRLVDFLKERFAAATNLSLVHDDALAWLRREKRDWSGWKLVANLPYSVASPIVVELAQAEGCPRAMVVTLQLEVAKRLAAKAGDADYGVLSLLVQLCYEPRDLFKIPADCFFPAPDVDSACVTLSRRQNPLLPAELRPAFVKIVKRVFSQRRKMMLKLLKQDWPEENLTRAMKQLGLSPQVRAEAVTLKQFVSLTAQISGQ
jgi:16S rRNA (adenine1518-N6/adenine1519-N6)-dimethyltransferase